MMEPMADHAAANEPETLLTQEGVITRYAKAWIAGDFATIVNCYDEQIVAHYGGQSSYAGIYHGRDRFIELLLETGQRGGRKLISIDQVDDGGTSGALFVTESFAINGETVIVQRALRFLTNGTTITECWLFDHQQHLVDQAWSQPLAPPAN
jgi:uncharacterized protein